MSTGADNKTMPVTQEYEEGFKRVYGDVKPKRGRWIWDDTLGRLVSEDEYRGPPDTNAKNAPILSGRFYENTKATDGTDIGSRSKHREYMRRHGVTVSSDYTQEWKRAAEKREAAKNGRVPSKTRREVLERKLHQILKP